MALPGSVPKWEGVGVATGRQISRQVHPAATLDILHAL